MKIMVGISGNSPGWSAIARCEGFPHAAVETADDLAACSAVIAGDDTPERLDRPLLDFAAAGGAMVCSPGLYARLSSAGTHGHTVRYLYAESRGPLEDAGFIDLDRPCRIAAGANALRTERGRPAAFAGEFAGGPAVVLPCDAGEAMADLRSCRRSFPGPGARKLPHEHVSVVARSAIVRLVAAALRWLHRRRGIPYVHLWYYPEGARSILALRVDTDDGSRAQIDELHAAARRLDVPLSWFVHVRAQEAFLDRFAGMREDEIGVHCYEHRPYRDPAAARADLRRATDLLAAAGAQPLGFAAPFGRWSPELDAVIAESGFEYSSEFSYDYDGFPSSPIVGGVLRPTLQVPVHPISIGSLRRQGCPASLMTRYYDGVIRRKLAMAEPLIFYHHPRDGNLQVLAGIAQAARTQHVVTMTMLEAARWWRGRSAVRCEASVDGDELHLAPGGWFVRVVHPDGREAVVPAAQRIALGKLPWHEAELPPGADAETFRARRFNPWIAVNAVEDRVSRLVRRMRP